MEKLENVDYTDKLSYAIESYLVFFETMTVAATAIFAACAVILLRESGIRRNHDIADTDWTFLIVAASGLSGLSLIFSKLVAPSALLAFHREILKGKAYPGCKVKGLTLEQYFSTCYSDYILLWSNRCSLALIALAGISLFLWFVRQWRRLKKS